MTKKKKVIPDPKKKKKEEGKDKKESTLSGGVTSTQTKGSPTAMPRANLNLARRNITTGRSTSYSVDASPSSTGGSASTTGKKGTTWSVNARRSFKQPGNPYSVPKTTVGASFSIKLGKK